MGLHVQGDALNAAFVRFKELADRKVEITEADLEAIVAEELGTGMVHRFSIAELEVHGGTAVPATARVVLADADGKIEATGTGNGMIDAAIAAVSEATGVSGQLKDFQVSSVTGGGDALGAVVVQLATEGREVTGRGVATDVVEASARAYLNAVNKIVRLRERGDTRLPIDGPTPWSHPRLRRCALMRRLRCPSFRVPSTGGSSRSGRRSTSRSVTRCRTAPKGTSRCRS